MMLSKSMTISISKRRIKHRYRSRALWLAALVTAATISLWSQSTSDQVFKSDVREVSVVFRVVDKNNQPVSGITAAEIQINDQGTSRKITSFRTDIAYAQVVILADLSGSMITVLEPLQRALYSFADTVSKDFDREPGDILLSLVPFGDTATMLIDRTSNPMEFKEAVRKLQPTGTTALVDSVMSVLMNAFGDKETSAPKRVAPSAEGDGPIPSRYRPSRMARGTAGDKRSKFLVLFTDAGENSSTHRWADIASAMLGKDVMIYSVQFDSGSLDSDFSTLSKVTLQSGGKVYKGHADNLGRVYAEIAKDIRSHHQLTFSAGDIENPRVWRNISLSTTHPGATIFARTGYCPETPCQKSDGSFAGGAPKTWNEVLSISRDPGVIASVRRRLQSLRFEYTAETEKIVKDLMADSLLIERVWNTSGKRSGKSDQPSFITRKLGSGNRLVNIDTEVCGITVDPETGSSRQSASSGEHALTVLSPEIRIARRPGSTTNESDSQEKVYFQSQAIFYLKDPSGQIPSRIRVQCNRPHFLIGDDLVQFAAQAAEYGLKTRLSSSTRSSQ